MKFVFTPRLALALSLTLISPLHARADGLLSGLVNDTLHITGSAIRGAGNIVSGTVDATGNVVDSTGRIIGRVAIPGTSYREQPSDSVILLGTANDVYGYSIDARRADLRRAVRIAESQDKINHSQASDLRADLERIASREKDAQSDHILSFDESLSLARDLDRVNMRLADAMNVQPFDSLVAVDSSGNSRMFVTTPRALDAESSTYRETRSITENGVTTTTTTTSNDSGTLSGVALYSVLDTRRFKLDRMIGDALDRRTIDADRASRLQSQLDRVRGELMASGSSGQSLTQDQAVSIARELDNIDTDVASALRVAVLSPLTIVDTTSGTAKIVTDQFGNVIGVRDAGPELYIGTLESRRRELEDVIARQQASGVLAAAQSQDLRAELERVARMQGEQRTTFSYTDALPLAITLDYVGNQIHKTDPTFGYVPLINDSRFVVSGGRVIMVDDVMVRRAELQSRIAREFAKGRISDRQHADLREEMANIAATENQMREKGSLTFRDSRALYQSMDKVGSQLDGYVAESRRGNISNR